MGVAYWEESGEGGSSPRDFLNFWISNCTFWCILEAILSAALLNSTGQRGTSVCLGGHGPLSPLNPLPGPPVRCTTVAKNT